MCERTTAATRAEKIAVATPCKTSTRTGLVESIRGKQLQNVLGTIGDSDALQNRYQNGVGRMCQRKTAANALGKFAVVTPFKTSTRTGLIESVSGKQLQNALGKIGGNDAIQNRYQNGLGRECQRKTAAKQTLANICDSDALHNKY